MTLCCKVLGYAFQAMTRVQLFVQRADSIAVYSPSLKIDHIFSVLQRTAQVYLRLFSSSGPNPRFQPERNISNSYTSVLNASRMIVAMWAHNWRLYIDKCCRCALKLFGQRFANSGALSSATSRELAVAKSRYIDIIWRWRLQRGVALREEGPLATDKASDGCIQTTTTRLHTRTNTHTPIHTRRRTRKHTHAHAYAHTKISTH